MLQMAASMPGVAFEACIYPLHPHIREVQGQVMAKLAPTWSGLVRMVGATCSGRRSPSILLKALKRPRSQLADSVVSKVGPGLIIPTCTSRADSNGGEDDAPTSS
ncbi:unnamed protein product [Polarella glacialis]|uniref:Uncharacterized protein n=1 Tax=Polarella glacialis TaxID=89957 RepID=A0A813F532_POLGL|nr:unnamed protein product [Polarella glacialis]